MSLGAGIFEFLSLLGPDLNDLALVHRWSFVKEKTKCHTTNGEAATCCQRLPPNSPSSLCGPYLLHFPDGVWLGTTGCDFMCFTGIGFLDHCMH
eukprot:6929079-Ditylum_brightwellii.AAC.2